MECILRLKPRKSVAKKKAERRDSELIVPKNEKSAYNTVHE